MFDVEMQKRNEGNIPKRTRFYQVLIDFLHYVDHSTSDSVPIDCDERLKHLHKKISEIKSNEQMGVSYIKMEERDRLIREEGEKKGIEKGIEKGMQKGIQKGEKIGEIKVLISFMRKAIQKNEDIGSIVKAFDLDKDETEKMIEAIEKHSDRTDREIAEIFMEE